MAPEVTEKDNSGDPSASTPISREEFTSLKSSMETRMDTLNELLTKLLEAHPTQHPLVLSALLLRHEVRVRREELNICGGADLTLASA